ncbi:MAG: hypothetical protein P8016_12640 [Sedimentisphaerales bacterium]
MQNKETDKTSEQLRKTFWRFIVVVIFGIALGYFEAAVVVYLREIFYPDGFTFPLVIFSIDEQFKRLFLTEVGREAASLVIIITGAWIFGRNRRQFAAYFLTIFAVWDIFYYVWLKALLDWPASIMDWDILFLIPMTWASPVLAPVLCSAVMLVFAAIILYSDSIGRKFTTTYFDWLAFTLASLIIIVSFCIPGPYTEQADYNSYFYWPLFGAGLLLAIGTFIKCIIKSEQAIAETACAH